MPRAPRVHVPGGLYHVILRGNHQQAVFDLPADYYMLEDLLARALRRYQSSATARSAASAKPAFETQALRRTV